MVRNVTPTNQALRRLGEILHDAPTYAVASTPGLRRLTEAVLAAEQPGKPLLKTMVELLSTALEQCYKDWMMREDPGDPRQRQGLRVVRQRVGWLHQPAG